jgi:hypothetical protein
MGNRWPGVAIRVELRSVCQPWASVSSPPGGATPCQGRPLVAERAGFEPAEHFCSRALQARALGRTMLPLRAMRRALYHPAVRLARGRLLEISSRCRFAWRLTTPQSVRTRQTTRWQYGWSAYIGRSPFREVSGYTTLTRVYRPNAVTALPIAQRRFRMDSFLTVMVANGTEIKAPKTSDGAILQSSAPFPVNT